MNIITRWVFSSYDKLINSGRVGGELDFTVNDIHSFSVDRCGRVYNAAVVGRGYADNERFSERHIMGKPGYAHCGERGIRDGDSRDRSACGTAVARRVVCRNDHIVCAGFIGSKHSRSVCNGDFISVYGHGNKYFAAIVGGAEFKLYFLADICLRGKTDYFQLGVGRVRDCLIGYNDSFCNCRFISRFICGCDNELIFSRRFGFICQFAIIYSYLGVIYESRQRHVPNVIGRVNLRFDHLAQYNARRHAVYNESGRSRIINLLYDFDILTY